jgi:DNA mismatch repair protein MSH3
MVICCYKCTPQELSVLLPAFNKIAIAFDAVENPTDVGFKSGVLNDIIYSLPKLKEPMKTLMEAVSLKNAAEGSKDTMWTDSERYPKIADADMVRFLTSESYESLNLSLR